MQTVHYSFGYTKQFWKDLTPLCIFLVVDEKKRTEKHIHK